MRDPEFVHDRILLLGNIMGSNSFFRWILRSTFRYDNPKLETEVCGVKFKNPIGLSAGFDKDGKLVSSLRDVGFGFMQVGSVTSDSYEGNPKPRLVRLKKSKALVVYYGLKNEGKEMILKRLKKKFIPKDFRISISIAKTNSDKTCTEESGVVDYFDTYKYFNENEFGDFYTINISCPNTFGGEPFTTAPKLEALLKKLREVESSKPLFIKMPLELSWNDFKSLLDVAVKYKVDGVIIANLVKDRKNNKFIKDEISDEVKGGISGVPTRELANEKIRMTYKEYGEKLKIVGVGGIFSAEDAYEKIKLGASLVQLITGMIYEGPQLIGEINRGLVKLLEGDGFVSIGEAVGVDA